MASTIKNGNDCSRKWQRPFELATTVYEREIRVGEVKDKWRAMVAQAKKDHSLISRSRKQTGGGKAPDSPDVKSKKLIEIFGDDPSFSGIAGGIETGMYRKFS